MTERRLLANACTCAQRRNQTAYAAINHQQARVMFNLGRFAFWQLLRRKANLLPVLPFTAKLFCWTVIVQAAVYIIYGQLSHLSDTLTSHAHSKSQSR